MKPFALKTKCALALVIGGILAAGPAIAEKPSWAGAGKGGKNERMDRRDESRGERRDNDGKSRRQGDSRTAGKRGHFEDRHYVVVRNYYGEQFRGGRCPPGLAKKHNGCMPPGQAKKWQVGRPLPHDVIYYSVPQPLVLQIGPPPSGHRYVRVAGDILMIAIGTGMVVDAINDLGRM
ncbi:MAG: RcnB family protein [Betaproteobacteria bacterium]|nr:RcnB family protein [Betaproteobacteria bacterium]